MTAMAGLLLCGPAAAQGSSTAMVYKDPNCGCCVEYAAYLRQHGFAVTTVDSTDLATVKQRHGVPEPLGGCHTTVIGDYAIEGHVPIAMIKRLLAEKPAVKGISLPGMPLGSPGMTGRKSEPFVVYEFSDAGMRVFDIE
jgi:hypothetical protein